MSLVLLSSCLLVFLSWPRPASARGGCRPGLGPCNAFHRHRDDEYFCVRPSVHSCCSKFSARLLALKYKVDHFRCTNFIFLHFSCRLLMFSIILHSFFPPSFFTHISAHAKLSFLPFSLPLFFVHSTFPTAPSRQSNTRFPACRDSTWPAPSHICPPLWQPADMAGAPRRHSCPAPGWQLSWPA